MLASQLLLMLGDPPRRMLKQTRNACQNRYSLLEGVYVGESDQVPFDHAQIGQIIQSVPIDESGFAVGKRLGELPFEEHRSPLNR